MLEELAALQAFQCPRGHFCFSDLSDAQWARRNFKPGFNALAGIFAFRTICSSSTQFGARHRVSMPSRAFLLFGLALPTSQPADPLAFQCPRGHFCFSDGEIVAMSWTWWRPGFNALAGIFAFRTQGRQGQHKTALVFQCPRGHFCFSDSLSGGRRTATRGFMSFNALAGIFAFRTRRRSRCSRVAVAGFNALAGIFAFRTRHPPQTALPRGVQLCFNALAGIFAFRT